MSKQSLKSKATKGFLWSAVERLSTQAGGFVVGIILARILVPDDFGLVGMLAIFMGLSQAFVDSGLGRGLVQKQDRTEKDYSTIFVFNFVISIVFYLILFFSAPLVADFFKRPELILLTRVLAISLILNALIIVQRAILIIRLDFKAIAKANIISVIISGALGIYFAFRGFGVWALVIQSLSKISVSVILFWYLSKWRFSLAFSIESFKELFGYGYKLLLAGIYAGILNNIYNLAIGKAYSAVDLGYYNRAKRFSDMASGTITQVIQQVTFPLLASLQSNTTQMVSVFRRLIRMTAFFVFPAMTFLSILASPLIRVLLGEKWLLAIPLLQIMAFSKIFYPISALNMNILNATGRSDLFLKLDLSKFPLVALALVISIPLGVKAMVIAQVITAFIAFFMNAYLPGKLYGYGPISQAKDLLIIAVITAVSGFIVLISIHYIEIPVVKLIIGSFLGVLSYLSLAYFLKIEELKEIMLLIRKP